MLRALRMRLPALRALGMWAPALRAPMLPALRMWVPALRALRMWALWIRFPVLRALRRVQVLQMRVPMAWAGRIQERRREGRRGLVLWARRGVRTQ